MKVEVKMPGQTISCSGENLELQLSGKVHLRVVDGVLKINAEPLDSPSNLSKSSTVQLIEQTSKILQDFDVSEDESVEENKSESKEHDTVVEETVVEEEPVVESVVQESLTTATEVVGTTETPTQLFSWTDEEETEQKNQQKTKTSTPTADINNDEQIEKRQEDLKAPVKSTVPVSVTKRRKKRQSRRITSVAELMSTIQKINKN